MSKRHLAAANSVALNVVDAMQFGYAEAKSLRAKIELTITIVIVAQSGGA